MDPYSPQKIQLIVEQKMPGARAAVRDMTGTNDHFELEVIAPQFEGKSLVERHRMVYGAIGPSVGQEIHALSLRTLTPEEEKKRKQ